MSLRDRQNQRGVRVYDPTRRLPAPRQAAAPRPAPRPTGDPTFDRQKALIAQARSAPEEDDGGGNPFGRGLGFLINNPVTQTLLKPLEIMDYGRRAVTLGIEEFAEGVTGQELEAQKDDERSNWDKLNDPTYGVGQLLGDMIDTPWDEFDKWANRGVGLVGDIAFDPLSYVTMGVGAVAGKGARASSLAVLREAQEAAVRNGDTALAKLLGGADEAQRLGKRGLGAANPAQAQAMGLRQGGIRLTSPLGGAQMKNAIPGTERIARHANDLLGRARTPVRALPGAKALRNTRNPIGFMGNDLGPAVEKIITGKGPGTFDGAIANIALDDATREIGNTWGGYASQTLERTVGDMKAKGYSIEQITDLARRAESGEVNEWSQIGDEMRAIAAEMFGVTLPKMEGGTYVMPHVLNRKFRNGLLDAARNGDAGAQAFMDATGLRVQDLTEQSGFLQRRSIRPNADGTPKELDLGGVSVSITEGSVEELNEKLATAFPWFDGGDIYETNPILAYQRYISGVSRDVGQIGGGRRVADSGLGDHVRRQGEAPNRFDPYGATEEMFDADGNTIERVVPNEGGLAEDEFWRAVPDKAATAERDKGIRSTQREVLDNLNTYSEAERADIGRELEKLADEVLAPMKDARAGASAARAQGEMANSRLNTAFNNTQDEIADLAARQSELTAEIEKLAKVRYGIERTAQQRAAKRQRQLLNALNERRDELASQRSRLEREFRGALELAQETDGSASSIVAARKQVEARVDNARFELRLAEQDAQHAFVSRYGDDAVVPKWKYTSAKKRVDAGKGWSKDGRTVRRYETLEGMKERATEGHRARLNQALREQGEFEQEARRLATPKAAAPAAPAVGEIAPATRAAADKAEKLLATPRARKLIADQEKLADLRRRAKNATAKNRAKLNKEVRALDASIEERSRLAAQLDRARAAIRTARANEAKLAREVQPKPTGIPPTPQPDLQRVLDTQQTVAQREAAADRGYIPRLAETEMEQTANAAQFGRIAAGADDEFNAIPLDEGMEAIGKRRGVDDAQERARLARTEAQQQAAELDEMTGGMVEAYKENLQNIEASRLEHERIAAEIGKGGQTAVNPQRRTEELAKRKTSKAGLDRVVANEVPPAVEQPLYDVVEDIRNLARANPTADDELLTRAEAALSPLERRLSKLTTEADIPARQTDELLKAAKKGTLAPVMRAELRRDWKELWRHGDVVISKELETIYKNLQRIDTEPHKFFRALTTYTNFFKTYATLTPGFHIRNGMSAVFMNYAMGVPSATQIEGVRLWSKFAKAPSPLEFWRTASKTERDAISAVLSSGAGGRYFEAGVADVTQLSTRAQERLFANRLTKASQKFGQDAIEGPVRTAMALDALAKEGADVRGTMQLIDRIHFDYSRVSEFDEKAKRLIPFWTFMSRNLPMQLTTMWTKPRTYARYNSFVRNFEGAPVEGTPEYFENIGAFPLGDAEVAGMPLFLQPDFAHTRLDEDLQNIEDLLSGENLTRPLTNLNPIFTAPVEFGTGRDFFTGREYDESDLREAGTLEKPFELLARVLGQTKTTPGGKTVVKEGFLDAMRSINPVYDRAVRVAPQLSTGGNEDDAMARQIESIARMLGAPTRTLSPQQRQSAQRADYYKQRDEQALARALLALDA